MALASKTPGLGLGLGLDHVVLEHIPAGQMRPDGLADYKSVKKPIDSCLILLRPDLKALMVCDSITL